YWRADARAAIVGLSAGSGRAQVVRAGLESIGFIVGDVLRQMGQEAGVELQMVHADGGAVRNRFLMQFVADITGLQVRAAQVAELSAFGACLAGGLGCGLYAGLEQVKRLSAAFEEYTPQMTPERRGELLAGWNSAVQRVL
ncbi:MAG: FGGY-family carbohydrate kinase, partial [Chloroflexota bacterium]